MVKIFFSKNGQVKVTIPKAIASAMQIKHGTRVEFIFEDKKLVMVLKDEQST